MQRVKDLGIKVGASKKEVRSNDFGMYQVYTCKIAKGDKHFYITFSDSIANFNEGRRVDKNDILSCVVLDAIAYDNHRDMEDFQECFGYVYGSKELKRAYNGCRSTYERLTDMLTPSEYGQLIDIVVNY